MSASLALYTTLAFSIGLVTGILATLLFHRRPKSTVSDTASEKSTFAEKAVKRSPLHTPYPWLIPKVQPSSRIIPDSALAMPWENMLEDTKRDSLAKLHAASPLASNWRYQNRLDSSLQFYGSQPRQKSRMEYPPIELIASQSNTSLQAFPPDNGVQLLKECLKLHLDIDTQRETSTVISKGDTIDSWDAVDSHSEGDNLPPADIYQLHDSNSLDAKSDNSIELYGIHLKSHQSILTVHQPFALSPPPRLSSRRTLA